MSVEERRRLEMFERLAEVLGADVADTVLAHLPPRGERVATAAQVEALRTATGQQIESLRTATEQQIESLRTATEQQVEALRAASEQQVESLRSDTKQQVESLRSDTKQQIESLRTEMHHLFEVQGERLAARWRRDLLLLAVPQFLVLLGIIVSLNV